MGMSRWGVNSHTLYLVRWWLEWKQKLYPHSPLATKMTKPWLMCIVCKNIESKGKNSKVLMSCPGLVDDVMIWIKEPFIKNEKSTIDVLILWVNKI